MEESFRLKDKPQERAEFLNAWAKDRFGMTAMHPASDAHGKIDKSQMMAPEGTAKTPVPNPCSTHLSDVIGSCNGMGNEELKQRITKDQADLCNFCQMHKCNGCCLKSKRKRRTKKAKNKEGARQACCHSVVVAFLFQEFWCFPDLSLQCCFVSQSLFDLQVFQVTKKRHLTPRQHPSTKTQTTPPRESVAWERVKKQHQTRATHPVSKFVRSPVLRKMTVDSKSLNQDGTPHAW